MGRSEKNASHDWNFLTGIESDAIRITPPNVPVERYPQHVNQSEVSFGKMADTSSARWAFLERKPVFIIIAQYWLGCMKIHNIM